MASSDNGAGGLMGSLDPDMLFSIGSGLLSMGHYGVDPGKAMAGAMQNYYATKQAKQTLGMNQLQLQQMQAEMPLRMGVLQALGNKLHIFNNDPQATPQLQGLLGSSPNALPQAPGGAAPAAAPSVPSSVPSIPGAPSLGGAAPVSAGLMAPPSTPAPSGAAPTQQGGNSSDPFDMMDVGTFAGLLGMQGAQGTMENAKTRLQYDPRVASQMKLAGSDMSTDQLGYQQAMAKGDNQTAQMYLTKMKMAAGTLQVARNSGIRQELGANGQWSMYNPESMTQGVGNSIAPIPGAVQTQQALAGAKATGTAQGELVQQTDKDGSVTGQKGATYYVQKSRLLGGSGSQGSQAPQVPGASAAGAPASGGPPIASLGPQDQTFLHTRGVQAADYLTELQKGADAARGTNYTIDQMLEASKNVQLGAGAPTRAWGEKWLSGIGQQFNVKPSSELAGYAEVEKYANQIAFAATKQMGSREAAQIVTMQMQSNPNKAMVPEAFYSVANSMKAMNSYIIDKNSFLAQAGEDAQGAGAKWTQQVDPRVWALTTSPQMAKKWGPLVGVSKIRAAFDYMSPDEQQTLISNLPANLLKAK
jgi:hypothetical protein